MEMGGEAAVVGGGGLRRIGNWRERRQVGEEGRSKKDRQRPLKGGGGGFANGRLGEVRS